MDDSWIVAADATLYYQADLKRQLGIRQLPENTVDLLMLALHRWGPSFARYVEGDYAIVAWERKRERLLLARDFGGRRNLAYATIGGSAVIASSPTAVVCHPSVSTEYDLTFLSIAASGNMTHGPRTVFRAVDYVPGGSTLSVEGGRVTEVHRWRPPPVGNAWEPEVSADAVEELRALLVDATRQRLAPAGPTSIWMSGGWDSPSVFAAGNLALRNAGNQSCRILPISVTYPPGDSGNEDDHIRAIAGQWGAPIRWVDVDTIPLIDDEPRRSAVREDPLAQPYESMVRVLAQNSRGLSTRVALEGFGGDHLFLVSTSAVMADHLFYGRWSSLWLEWRRWGGSSREFARNVLLPHLSPDMRQWIGAVRGRPLAGFWDRTLAGWIIPSAQLISELAPEFERQPGEGAAEFEVRALITNSFVSRAVGWNHVIGLEEGVQPRGPLFDQRLIDFAVARPMSDRGIWGDSKLILRRAMQGLLPDSVLAPRPRKTGTPAEYFRRQLQGSVQGLIKELFADGRSCLERMGLIDRSAILAAAEEYATKNVHFVGAILHFSIQTERWLAVREEWR
jgi:asparagine synthase (glutamine-hydrolysing)